MANTTTTKTVAWPRGVNILRAGTPLDTDGKVANDATAVGIVAADLYAPDRTATIITAGEWDESVNAPWFHISDAAKLALSDITFSRPAGVPLSTTLSGYVTSTALETALAGYAQASALADYVQKTNTATTEAAGVVLQAEAVADLEEAPTASDFNNLLDALRDAGVMAAPAEEEPAEEPAADPA